MSKQTFYTAKAPQIVVERCDGNLDVRSWADTTAVQAKGDELNSSESETGLTLTCSGDLKLVVPRDSSLSIHAVGGDLLVKNVAGDVVIQEAQGDVSLSGLGYVKVGHIAQDLSAQNIDGGLSLDSVEGDISCRSLSQLSANQIGGDLSASYIVGNVTLGNVAGDASLRTVNGDLTMTAVQRDVNLRNLGGKNEVSGVEGDIRLVGGLSASKHSFAAAGDIIVRWPADAPLIVTATAPHITNRLKLQNVVEDGGSLSGTLGDGQTAVSLTAGGSIVLKDVRLMDEKWERDGGEEIEFDFIAELEGLGERIAAQLNERMSGLVSDLETRFGPEFSQKMAEKISRTAEQAAAKAEEAAEKIARRVEQAAARAEQVSQQPRPERRTSPPPKAEPEPPKASSTEEKLKILKMVENGTITPAEAEMLLRALDGNR